MLAAFWTIWENRHIISKEFIEPTKRAENALEGFYGIIKDRYYHKVSTPVDKTVLEEFKNAFYTLLSYLYVLRLWGYEYERFLDDAIENGVIKPKYKPSKEGGAYVREKNQQSG